jgi:hypothetical protein
MRLYSSNASGGIWNIAISSDKTRGTVYDFSNEERRPEHCSLSKMRVMQGMGISKVAHPLELNGATKRSAAWPEGKQFGFTIFDDTDFATLENVAPVYSFLSDQGFATTKSVWPTRSEGAPFDGSTCEDAAYLAWLLELQQAGFEIGYHMAGPRTSTRECTSAALDRFRSHFGSRPKILANHTGCSENIYWGRHRLTGFHRWIYDTLSPGARSCGHVEGSPLFWGDLCRTNIKYVRNFVFKDIDTLRACPIMPYHDPQRPYVNYWFASSEGSNVRSFVRCINETALDRLEATGSACIMYTHFASGFYNDGRLHPGFENLMKRLAKKNGWFVPVSTMLDHLLAQNRGGVITDVERSRLERRWLLQKIFVGRS